MELRPMAVLAAFAALLALTCCGPSGAKADRDNTPQAAFESLKRAAAAGDFGAFYDLCDDKGQEGLCELGFQLITMEIYDRKPSTPTDVASIKNAFHKELDLSPEQVENAQSDPVVRRKVFLQILRKSRGVVGETFGEALAEFAKHEVVSCEDDGRGVAKLQLRSARGNKTWYMVRREDKWVMAGGMSPYKPEK